MRRQSVAAVLGAVGLALAWAKAAPAEEWTPLFVGVSHKEFTRSEPRLMVANVLRIDLKAKGIEFVATPSNGEAPGETDGMRTSSFLAKTGCQVAINAAPFSPIHLREGQPQDVKGLLIANGETISPAKNSGAVILVRAKNKVTISSGPLELDGVQTGVAGFFLVLWQGQPVGGNVSLHPRTAAAVSEDGRYLYLLVVDGRQQGYSEGATPLEIGTMLKELGGWNGINLDGGGTTTMVMEGKNGKAKVLNCPINAGIPGFERVSGSHLGVRAEKLK